MPRPPKQHILFLALIILYILVILYLSHKVHLDPLEAQMFGAISPNLKSRELKEHFVKFRELLSKNETIHYIQACF